MTEEEFRNGTPYGSAGSGVTSPGVPSSSGTPVREHDGTMTFSPVSNGGLTLRDQFAMFAMQAVLNTDPRLRWELLAETAYGIADEMLVARDKERDIVKRWKK